MTTDDRKTKAVAQRIDSTYHRKPSPLRTLRRVLVVVCGLAAAAWGGWAIVGKNERLYNPGPVSAAHAMFENDCSQCHDGGGGGGSGGGGFRKTVSDSACLKCHDGAIHAEKQTTLVSLGADGKPEKSSGCVTCHVEHKGHAALAGTSDMHCTKCHDNLAANVAGATSLAASIRTFDAPPAHPPFGRAIPKKDDKWWDSTPLKFNHAKHFEKRPELDCASCHQTGQTGERRIMIPVSYDAHCKACHPLSLGVAGIADIPHESMDVVRQYAGSLLNDVAQKLLTATAEEREKLLTTTKKGRGIGAKPVVTKVSEAEWLADQLKALTKLPADDPALAPVQAVEPAKRGVATLELYIGSVMQYGCNYCHEVRGAPTGVAKSPTELLHTLSTGYAPAHRAPTTAPAPPASGPTTRPLATPEGRRWFTASVFDHDAHRGVGGLTCLSCHAGAKTSALTADLLLPDAKSCATCHHPGGASAKAASNNCITCHVYHDRARERPPASGVTR